MSLSDVTITRRSARIAVLGVLLAVCALAGGAFLPSRTQATTYNPLGTGHAFVSQFSSQNSCKCHPNQQDQWGYSMHAKSYQDPFYRAQSDKAGKQAGAGTLKFCNTCHTPAALMSGGLETLQQSEAMNGLTCNVCHGIVKQTAKTPGNASLAYSAKGPDSILRAQITDPHASHSAQGLKLYDSSEFCGACHNVTHPGNGLHLESTYSEWKKSSYAAQGVTCQKCHMGSHVDAKDITKSAPYTEAVATGSDPRKNVYAMSFIGANVAQGDAGFATSMLKKAATVTITAPEALLPAGQKEKVTVNVKNVGAGHSIPTGLTEVRNMYLEIIGTDKAGKKTVLGTTVFGTELVDASGKKVGASFWKGVKVKKDTCIKAGETYTQTVEVTMPAGTDTQVITADLKYQSARDKDIKSSGVSNPTTVMASAKQGVFATAAAKSAYAAKNAPAKKKAAPSKSASAPAGDKTVWYGVITGAIVLVVAIIVIVLVERRKKKRA